MALNGWSDTVYIEHANPPTIANNLSVGTMACWLYITGTTQRQTVFGLNGSARYEINLSSGSLSAAWQNSSGLGSIGAPVANFTHWGTSKWVFGAFTFDMSDSTACRAWFGDLSNPCAEPSSYSSQTANTTPATDDSSDNFRVGRHPGTTGRQVVGSIGTIWFFPDVVLSQAELRELQWSGRVRMGDCDLYTEYGFGGATGTQPNWTAAGVAGTVTGTPVLQPHVPKRAPFGFDIAWHEAAAAPNGRIMSSLANHGGLAGMGGIAGQGGGLAG